MFLSWVLLSVPYFYPDIIGFVNITRVNKSNGRAFVGSLTPEMPVTGTALSESSRRGHTMLTVHHLNNSRSQRVLWLLEELGVPYEIVRYERQPSLLAPKELRAIHPLGKSPVITDNGNTIAESGAIIEYLVETYGNGRLIPPPNAPALLRPLVRKVSSQALTTVVNPQLKQHMNFWEAELSKSEWFAGGEFTAADIQMSFPLEAAAARGGLEQGHPRAMAFL